MRETPEGDRDARPAPPLDAVRAFMHDARTPLNAIVAFSDMLCAAPAPATAAPATPATSLTPEDAQRWGRLINSAARYLLALTGSVPVDAQAPAVASGAATNAVDLPALADEVLHWLQPEAQRQRVTIERGPLAGRVQADAASVQRVLTNLLSNAIRHNQTSGSIGLKTLPRLLPGEPVVIEITDSGHGMPPAQVQQLERQDQPGAAGLGLEVVQRLLAQMSGRLEVTSYRGLGTCVRISLPAADAGASSPTEA